jgi:hypothetical protein
MRCIHAVDVFSPILAAFGSMARKTALQLGQKESKVICHRSTRNTDPALATRQYQELVGLQVLMIKQP